MRKFLLSVGILALLGVPWASATVEVRIINTAGGGDRGWIVCGGTSCNTGIIVVGNYSIASNIAIKDDVVNPFLDVSYDAHTNVTGAGTIIFEAIADGYTTNATQTQVFGSGNSTMGDMITFASYGGNNNTSCAGGVNGCTPASNGALLATVGPPNDNVGFNQGAFGGGNTVTRYELGVTVTLVNPTSQGGASGDIQVNAFNVVPEPASVSLLGGVMLFAVSTIRRKMRRAQY
jgi:hypothetical protein